MWRVGSPMPGLGEKIVCCCCWTTHLHFRRHSWLPCAFGAIPIPVDFLARPEDFGYFLDDSYAVAALVDHAFLEIVGLGPQIACSHLGMVEPESLNGVGVLDVDGEVVRVEFEVTEIVERIGAAL